ncbi:MAG TPA: penicillin-binding transpeptidase domain-containing protein, partial [Rubrivivax sp.]|nr:penicillin-binding transpeptidase domain-containing protein [Rubrivivax sp.]
RWYAGETLSLGIGQGYNNFTMLQMANATATLVSGGQRYRPRLVREVEDAVTGQRERLASDTLEPLPLEPEHVALIRSAMHGVTQEGTGTRVFAGAPYASGGKTGTAQAVGVGRNEKYDAAKLEEFKRDHSLYIAAAPIDAPTVVLAVVVENAGFGAAAAAPIARRVFDYLLLGHWPSEEDMAATREGRSAAPLGTPRVAADMPLPGQPATPDSAASAAAATSASPATAATAAPATRSPPPALQQAAAAPVPAQ